MKAPDEGTLRTWCDRWEDWGSVIEALAEATGLTRLEAMVFVLGLRALQDLADQRKAAQGYHEELAPLIEQQKRLMDRQERELGDDDWKGGSE